MSPGFQSIVKLVYLRPTVTDYGTIVMMASDLGLLLPGVAGGASLSAPTAPGGGGDVVTPDSGGSQPQGGEGGPGGPGGEGGPGGIVEVGDVNTTGGGGGPSGGGAGGGPELAGAAGGGRGEHPFTGFPAALVAAVGGTLAATGAALRRAFRIGD
jgi:hypothetical protein